MQVSTKAKLFLSKNKIGFTAAKKGGFVETGSGFIFNEKSEKLNGTNHVSTQFNATNKAVKLIRKFRDDKVIIVYYNNSLTAVSINEAKKHDLNEVWIIAVSDNEVRTWIDSPF